jgi:hypothetical protein
MEQMSFTVVPVHNLNLPTISPIAFGNDFVLQSLPEWVKKDESQLERLSAPDRAAVLAAQHALVAEYDAQLIGAPDLNYKGKTPRTIQQSKSEAAIWANLALWLVQPSTACFTIVFHATVWKSPDLDERVVPAIQQTENHPPMFCHPYDQTRQLSTDQVEAAGRLCAVLMSIPPNSTLWSALRYVWAALTMYAQDLRHPIFWIALEALFGPRQDSGEIAYKLAQRIAFLTANDADEAKYTFRKAKACYSARSKIVHGRFEGDPKMLQFMADTEAMVRAVLLHLLNDSVLLEHFLSSERDTFLEDMVFARYPQP